MPTVDEVRGIVSPRELLAAPGVTRPKNDVLYVKLKEPSQAARWYATLQFGETERAMGVDEYRSLVAEPTVLAAIATGD